jgi:hypothetical protein
MSAPARRASGVGELLGYPAWVPPIQRITRRPLPRSALAASGVRVSVGPRRRCAACRRGAGAALLPPSTVAGALSPF